MYCPVNDNEGHEVAILPSLFYDTLSPFDLGNNLNMTYPSNDRVLVQKWCRLFIYYVSINLSMFLKIMEAYLLVYLSYDLLSSIRNPISIHENKIPKFAMWAVLSLVAFVSLSSLLQMASSFWDDGESQQVKLNQEVCFFTLTLYIFIIGLYVFVLRVLIGTYFGVFRRRGLSIAVKNNILRDQVSFLILKLIIYFPLISSAYNSIYFLLKPESASMTDIARVILETNDLNNENNTQNLKIFRSCSGIFYFIYAVSDYKFRTGIQQKVVLAINKMGGRLNYTG